jgi:DNA polymerase-1
MPGASAMTTDQSTLGIEGTQGPKPSLYIIDALNFLFRAFHALPPLKTTKGTQTGAIYGLCQMILKIEREQKPTHLCVVYDAPGETFRNALYDQYKAHRPPMPPELADQLGMVRRVIEAFGLAQLEVPGFEADDVIATLTKVARAAGMDVVICSSDKDLTQLCTDDGGVWVLDTMKNRRIGPAEVREKFGVGPDRVGDVLALMGDSIDNVPGVAGIGPKTASELINKFGNLDALLAAAAAGGVPGKRGIAVHEAREAVRVSRELVQLRDDAPLPKTLAELHRIEPDKKVLRGLFVELEFSRLVDQLSASGAAAIAPHAENTPPPVLTATPEAVAPAPPPPRVPAIANRAELDALAADIRAAGAFGVAALYDGPSAVRSDLVGIAFAIAERRAYVPLTHRYLGAPQCLPEPEALSVLAPLFASAEITKHVHDAKTLEVLLLRRGLPLAGVGSDSMLAAYLLDASRTRYDLDVVSGAEGIPVAGRTSWMGSGASATPGSQISVEEVGAWLAAEAAAALGLAARQPPKLSAAGLDPLYRDMELPLAHVLAHIECRGIKLDIDRLREIGQEVGTQLAALEGEIHGLAGTPFNINSPKQLADVLFGKLSLPVIRKTKTGPSTDADTLEELATLHPVPAKIVDYRILSKLKGTYIDALPALVNPATGRLHTSFNQAVAATGRLSSSNPNLQNIPIRTEVGRRIRQAFVAKPGCVLVAADYSQIELRILAHFSQDPAFLDAFRSGEDIHQRTAAEVFGVPSASVTAEHRRIAKAINFGLSYGQSDFGLAQVLRIPRAQARTYIQSYFERYAGVRAYMERTIAEARATAETVTLLGRRRPLPEIRATRVQDRNYAERIARNTPIQGSAADLLKLAMIRVDRAIESGGSPVAEADLLLTVHDELVFEVPAERSEDFKRWVKNEMESVYKLDVPLVVDVGAGQTWGEAH